MTDVGVSLGFVGALAAAALAYAARAALRGRATHPRADADGGSVFLGKRAMEMGYWLAAPLVRGCVALGVGANAVTGASLGLGLAAGLAVGQGHLGVGAVLGALAALGDLVDGLVARETGSASDGGRVLDSTVDRYTELAFLGGLAFHYRSSDALLAIAIAALGGAFMVSYVSARAEAIGVRAPRGVMRRSERAVYLVGGAVAAPLCAAVTGAGGSLASRELPMVAAVTVVAVVANLSAAARLLAVVRSASIRPAASPTRTATRARAGS